MADLKELQELPLRIKIDYAKGKIEEFVEWAGGPDKVYISFSGGKDSTVLATLARELYPDISMLWVDTGLEFPEIKTFVREKIEEGWNVEIARPRLTFVEVIERYGYPVISKETSMAISRYRNTKREDQRQYRLYGRIVDGVKHNAGTIPKKWHDLAKNGSFKISERCCHYLKKEPFKKYEKKSGKHPIIGTMAGESRNRKRQWEKYGCNSFDLKTPCSKPLSIWTEDDIWEFIRERDIEVAAPYSMGYDRTGCIFCCFGIFQEPQNRFIQLQRTHPKLHRYVIDRLGFGNVLTELGVEYEEIEKS